MKTQFEDYTTKVFNLVFGTDLKPTMTFQEAIDNIELEEISYFYVSMRNEDVLEAIKDEKEVADILDLRLIFIEDLGIYIATY
jgi:hypothetical protein